MKVDKREFATIEALVEAEPDLERAARELLTEVPQGAVPGRFTVFAWCQGVGELGSYETAIVDLELVEPAAPPNNWTTIGKPVTRRRQAERLDDLFRLISELQEPAWLSGDMAREALKWATLYAGRIEQFKAVFADRPPPPERWDEFFAYALQALDQAYRAGRFMREAELGGRFDEKYQKYESTRISQSFGAFQRHEERRAHARNRMALIKSLAEDFLLRDPPNKRKQWDRTLLATNVYEALNLDPRPAIKTIREDLKKLGLP